MVFADGLLGLASWLFFLDLNPTLVDVCDISCFKDGRMGDVLREVCGLLLAETGADGARLLEGFFRSVGTDALDDASLLSGGAASR